MAEQEHAEFYAQMMVRQGLRSAIEPESDLASWAPSSAIVASIAVASSTWKEET